jgi:transaldolase
MTGRVDDYIFDIVADRKLSIPDSDIRQCGIAITKRAYQMFRKRGYEAVLMPTGMRGEYHAEALSGGEMVMSINPKIQVMLPKLKAPYLEHIGDSVDAEVIDRLSQIPEFVQAYEPDGMIEEQFISCGMVQRTLSQFIEHWLRIENFQLHSFD